MIREIVIIVRYPFSTRDYERYGLAEFHKQGWKTSVWDISEVLYPGLSKKFSFSERPRIDSLRLFTDESDLMKEIQIIRPGSTVLAAIGYAWDVRRILASLSCLPISLGSLELGSQPAEIRRSIIARIKTWLTHPSRFAESFFVRTEHERWGIRQMDFFITAGAISLPWYLPVGSKTKFIQTHSGDYDDYLKHRIPQEGIVPERTAVFLDQFLPFHPDFHMSSLKTPCTTERYHTQLRNFFDWIEKAHQLEVVIAAHPKSSYPDPNPYFGNRKTIRDRTVELVRDAKLVLSHASTSVNFAVLFDKPVLFLTSSELKTSILNLPILQTSSSIQSPICDIDQPHTWTEIASPGSKIKPDRLVYEEFVHKYIKTRESPREGSIWEIVTTALNAQID